MQTLLLPCRHVFFYRRMHRYETVIPPLQHIDQRWSLRSPANNLDVGAVSCSGVRVQRTQAQPFKQLTDSEKYIETRVLLEKIADVMKRQGSTTYASSFKSLQDFYSQLSDGKIPRVSTDEFPSLSEITLGGAQPSQLSILQDDGHEQDSGSQNSDAQGGDAQGGDDSDGVGVGDTGTVRM